MKKKTLSKALRKHATKKAKRKEPLWKGPEVDGITQSMIGSWLACHERFRLKVIDGLDTLDEFSHRLEYGQMWHTCEEYEKTWEVALKDYTRGLCERYKLQQPQIEHWYNVCKTQFPIYLECRNKLFGKQQIKPLLREQTFRVPYKLPSGRVVLLRGKWDGVNLLGKGRNAGIYLLEHKTKGDINEQQIERQLTFDLQTMTYLVALQTSIDAEDPNTLVGETHQFPKNKVKGVTYNVVRRPLSGGKGSIRQHKATKNKPAEISEHFYNRLGEDYIRKEPESFFMRWQVDVSPQEIKRFRDQCLDPILENICWWYSNLIKPEKPSEFGPPPSHWRHPYGVYNPMDQGRVSDLDDYLATGSKTGLRHVTKLFMELNNG